MKIVPAILSETIEDFLFLIRQAETFTDYVQIDLMDGFFVPSRSFPEEKINDIETSLSFELHLMVKHPSAFMSRISHPGMKKVIYHFESDVKHFDFIKQILSRGLMPGLAINPETTINQFRKLVQYIDTLLFLTVTPGKYGSHFRHEVVDKITESRKIFPDKIIAVDGGVSLDNIKTFFTAGVDNVCVGSRIFLTDNPKASYEQFINKLSKLTEYK